MTRQFKPGDRAVVGTTPYTDVRAGDTVTITHADRTGPFPIGARDSKGVHRLFAVHELRASTPTPKYPVGTRVLLRDGKQPHHAFDGVYGTVVPTKNAPEGYDITVRPDGCVFDVWFHDDEVTEVLPAPAEPQPKFKRGDKVVYTIPETFGGVLGTEAAARPEGTKGTVIEQESQWSVQVNWENDFRTATSVEFVAHAPTPTHKHPEGLYRTHAGTASTYIAVRHEAEPETYRLLYISNALDGVEVPVNSGMTKLTELGYTLVTEFPA